MYVFYFYYQYTQKHKRPLPSAGCILIGRGIKRDQIEQQRCFKRFEEEAEVASR